MSWKFDYVPPVFVILLIFLVFFIVRPKLYTRIDRGYIVLILTEIATLLFDVLSSYVDNHYREFAPAYLYALDGLFFVFFILSNFALYGFFSALYRIRKGTRRRLAVLNGVVVLLSVLFVCSAVRNGLLFYVAPDGSYHRGKLYGLIYVSALYFLFLISCLIIKKRARFSRIQNLSCAACVLILLFGCALREMFPEYMVMNLLFLFVTVILYVAFENPDIFIDGRTQLFNRPGFLNLLEERFEQNRRPAVLVIVIKSYNNKRIVYGTGLLDKALSRIGEFIRAAFPKNKAFYLRDGHFVILAEPGQDTEILRSAVAARFGRPWESDGTQIYLSVSFIELRPDLPAESFGEIVDCLRISYEGAETLADGGCMEIDRKSFEAIRRGSKVRKVLHRALENDEIEVYYQPIIDANTRKIVAAEALARLVDGELGVIPPAEFISVAEKNGNIEQLGEQVLRKVCLFLSRNDIQPLGIRWINVNLSPVQCQNLSLSETLTGITRAYSVDSDRIHLEITEESMIDPQVMNRQMRLLISDGYNFSLDDYGAGFSNIMRVKKYPFNNIKLDMQIVWDHFKEPDNILPGIINIFTDRGLSVTAEGVESGEMADALQKMGCTYLQGFYFSRPVPEDEFLAMLK